MKPILFNVEMVRAILAGRKTVTRRSIKDMDIINGWDCEGDGAPIAFIDQATGDSYPATMPCPYQPGDILYVRETWTTLLGSYIYKADQKPGFKNPGKWRPSIHMPREAARIFLRVTGVRVERLQKITPEQLRAEGFPIFVTPSECENSFNRFGAVCDYKNKLEKFSNLWNSTIKPADCALYRWDANPWVWVIEFERSEKPEEER